MSVSVCNFVVFTDYERPISTNTGSMEVVEYGLTRGARFVARRLEVVAVAGLLWISWCVSGAAGFFHIFFQFFFVERTWCAASIRPPCLIYLSTSICTYVHICIRTNQYIPGTTYRCDVPLL